MSDILQEEEEEEQEKYSVTEYSSAGTAATLAP
jgi:hypothetical protein